MSFRWANMMSVVDADGELQYFEMRCRFYVFRRRMNSSWDDVVVDGQIRNGCLVSIQFLDWHFLRMCNSSRSGSR